MKPSRGGLWEAYQTLLKEKQLLENEFGILKRRLEDLLEIKNPGRRSYGPDFDRDSETGRVVDVCKVCGERKTLHARGMCNPCYQKWRRRNYPRPEKLGSVPLTNAEFQRLKVR